MSVTNWEERARHFEEEWIRTKRQLKLTEGKLKKLLEGERVDPEVEELGDYYRQVFGKNDRWVYDESRRSLARAAIRRHGMEDCKRAVRGYHRFPYVTSTGRSAQGKPSERFDSFNLIFRDAEQVEKGHRYLEREVEVKVPKVQRTKNFNVTTGQHDDPILNVLKALERLDKTWRANPTNTNSWTAQCPAHDDGKPSLVISRDASGKALCWCRTGCSQSDVLMALNIPASWLFPLNQYEDWGNRQKEAA